MREDTRRSGSPGHLVQRAGRSAGVSQDKQGRECVSVRGEEHQSGIQGRHERAQRDRAEAEGRIWRRLRPRAGAAEVRSLPERALQPAAGALRGQTGPGQDRPSAVRRSGVGDRQEEGRMHREDQHDREVAPVVVDAFRANGLEKQKNLTKLLERTTMVHLQYNNTVGSLSVSLLIFHLSSVM